ncbi:hypothetical protein HDU81_001824 [Chytriomyces hyalinus]|nr:hypothetical protein HDU81_001824 [Chytriomyces hyalinus]
MALIMALDIPPRPSTSEVEAMIQSALADHEAKHDAHMAAFKANHEAYMAALKANIDAGIAVVRSEIGSVRSRFEKEVVERHDLDPQLDDTME